MKKLKQCMPSRSRALQDKVIGAAPKKSKAPCGARSFPRASTNQVGGAMMRMCGFWLLPPLAVPPVMAWQYH